jgi:hypothetical protein
MGISILLEYAERVKRSHIKMKIFWSEGYNPRIFGMTTHVITARVEIHGTQSPGIQVAAALILADCTTRWPITSHVIVR